MQLTVKKVNADSQVSGQRTVKAGYFYNGDFMHKNEDGAYAGYDIEYYDMVAGYADWSVEFVEYDSLNSALAALKSGEIDMMSGLSKTQERENSYLIANVKMCTSKIAVQTRSDDDRFAPGRTETMGDMTCGILKGSNVITLYTDWCGQNGMTPHIVEYDSIQLRNQALMNKEVDAIAGGSTIEGAQKIAEFPALDLYFMFNKDKNDIKAQADRAMSILSLENPTFATDLQEKYFPSSRNSQPSFSAEEKKTIAAYPSILVAVLRDDAPFSMAGKDGTISGIIPEYFSHLSQLAGIKFKCVPYDSKDEECAALSEGRADIIAKYSEDLYDATSRNLILSVSYLRTGLVQISRAGKNQVASAAVPQCNLETVTEMLKKSGAEVTVESFMNASESFEEMKKGKVDSVICTQPAAAYLLNRNRSSDFVLSAIGNETCSFGCAFRTGQDGNTLRSILNKTIAVDSGYIDQLITGDTLQDSADLSGIFDRLPLSFIAACAAAAIALLFIDILALIVIIRRRKTEHRLAVQQAELAAAVETTKARHVFFGNVSHDMRTPLNGIVGFADLALKSNDTGTMKDYLRKIRASGEVLSGLVNDTLIMSRIENGKYILHPSPCTTEEIFSGIVEPVRQVAAEKEVHFEDDISGLRCRSVLADRLSVQKIILNLLSNALKYTPAGGTVTLKCFLDPENAEQPDTVIVVSDTGKGISKEFLPRIFEPFSQENPSNADTSGSGMGLSIVKSIVEAMDGNIHVESEPGAGTKFTVRLHLNEITGAAGKDGDNRQDGNDGNDGKGGTQQDGKPDFPRLKGKRALLCEDNALNLEIARTILERSGMEVTGAENGEIGVKKFRESADGYFDIILLDLRMPVMDGKTASQAIRALNRRDAATVPIFAVSADAYPENVDECIRAGMNAHISKPIDSAVLLRTILDYLPM